MGGGMWKSCLSVSLSTADTRTASLPAAVIWKLCFRSVSCPLRLSFSHPFVCLSLTPLKPVSSSLESFARFHLQWVGGRWFVLILTWPLMNPGEWMNTHIHLGPGYRHLLGLPTTILYVLHKWGNWGWCKVFLWSLASGVYQSHLGVLKLQLPVLTHSVSHGVCTLIILSLIFMWCPCRGRILGWGNCPSPWRVNVSILRSEALSHWFWGTRREWMEALVRFLIHVSLDLELRIFFPKPPCCCPWICLS